MRVSTAFNRMLAIPGANVASVSFTPAGIVVGLRRRTRRLRCPCGYSTGARYDASLRRWRHLDLGASRLWLEAEIRRLECRRCGRVRTEEVPWARPGARHTRDFQDVVAWLAQRTDKTTVTRLLRCSWRAVADIVVAVVAEAIDDTRLENLYRIGVDDISFRKGHRYLTVVADHDRDGAVIWAKEGRNSATLEAFYDDLGAERAGRLEAVSMDMAPAYSHATTLKAPQARQCVDPFHVVQLANLALDKVRRAEVAQLRTRWRAEPRWGMGRPRNDTPRPRSVRPELLWVKYTRWALVKDPARLSPAQLEVLEVLRRRRSALYRAWQLKEALRDLYRLEEPADAARYLAWWLAWASRSRIPAFVSLANTVRHERPRILAAVELGLSNSRLEGLNSKIRLINHRGYGHHSAAALIAMIYLCAGGISLELPFG